MLYQSTRGDLNRVSGAKAITCGLANDGGLFVPETFPTLTSDSILELTKKSYSKRTAYIIGLFMSDFTSKELEEYSDTAYSCNRDSGFTNREIAPLYKTDESTHFLELWHGPTCAFKDMALQIMPRLLTGSLKKLGEKREVCVLVATSGDTGKAALNGFCDVQGTKIMVFYPRDGVSEVQKLQMTTQHGDNVNVIAVEGNFDDAQTGVKAIFTDDKLDGKLDEMGCFLSSANSINWGRLVPQIAYYVSAYCDLINKNEIIPGEKINFCVPTGNFGNILAAYYAERMGLPINKLICASNRNDVLAHFINTGQYNKNRPFYTTISPSMDILVSSNLERLLFELSGKNGETVKSYMSALISEGQYQISDNVKAELSRIFQAGYCSEEDTKKTIKYTFKDRGYLIDTHTAVAYKVLQDYRERTSDDSVSVVVSTASPYKFCEAVLEALGIQSKESGANLIDELAKATRTEIPAPLRALKNEKERFTKTIKKTEMKSSVLDFVRGR